MRLSQKAEYALMAVVSLAQEKPGNRVPAGQLADRLGLPRRVVEQQFSALSKAGIVVCHRGPGGGCSLGRDPRDISAAEVVEAVDGQLVEVATDDGPVADLLSDALGEFARVMGEMSIAELAERERRRSGTAIYYI